jgi:hypothetical protein
VTKRFAALAEPQRLLKRTALDDLSAVRCRWHVLGKAIGGLFEGGVRRRG